MSSKRRKRVQESKLYYW